MRAFSLLLLSIWLIVQAILSLSGLHFPYEKIVLPSIALVSGSALLLHVLIEKLGNIGYLLLGSWLVLSNLTILFKIKFPYDNLTLALLSLLAGIFLLIKK